MLHGKAFPFLGLCFSVKYLGQVGLRGLVQLVFLLPKLTFLCGACSSPHMADAEVMTPARAHTVRG